MIQKVGVLFRGTRNGFTIALNETMDFDILVNELEQKLAEYQDFVLGARVSVDSGHRRFSNEEIHRLREILEGKYDMKWRYDENSVGGSNPEGNTRVSADTLTAMIIRRTVRSGQRIEHSGSIVVLGDVNPGAEILAYGDIIVFGTLRGVAHAGWAGNEDAIIVANRMRATQLRIAGCIARSPDAQGGLPDEPEVARIRSGVIVIEDYSVALETM